MSREATLLLTELIRLLFRKSRGASLLLHDDNNASFLKASVNHLQPIRDEEVE